MDFLFGYDETKMKPYLKMAVHRLKLANNKKGTAVKHQKKEIAKLLEDGKEEKARIKVEHIIREDFTMESYEIIELLCELLHERVKYLSSNKECPPDLLEAVTTLIWCTPRVDIEELNEVKKQLIKKFGKEFGKSAQESTNENINERLMNKLNIKPPSANLVISYLKEIAIEYNVAWEPTNLGVDDLSSAMPTPVGFSVPMAPGSEFRSVYQRQDNNGSGGTSTVRDGLAPMPFVAPPPLQGASTSIPPSVEAPPVIAPAPPTYNDSLPIPAPEPEPSKSVPTVPVAKPLTQPPSMPPSAPNDATATTTSSAPSSSTVDGSSPSYDDLAARFAALRNNKQ